MSKPFLFGLNLYIKNTQYLQKSLESITLDETAFKKDTQIFLFDNVATEDSKKICRNFLNKYPDNITYVEAGKKTLAECYNLAVSQNSAVYLNFTNTSIIFGKHTFTQIRKFLKNEQPSLFAMHTKFFDPDKGIEEHIRNKQSVYNLSEKLFYLPLFIERYFISSDILDGLKFKENLHEDCTKEFLIRCISYQEEITLIKKTCMYYCNAQERSILRFPLQTMRWWYLDQMRDFILPMLKEFHQEGSIPVHIQSLLLYLIEIKFYFNRNMRYKYIIRKDEVDEFYTLVHEALQYIKSDVIIINSVKKIAPVYLCYQLLRIKIGEEVLLPEFKKGEDGHVYAYIDGIPFTDREKIIVSKQAYVKDKETGEKVIKCELFYNYLFDKQMMDFQVLLNGEIADIEIIDKDAEVKYFGKILRKRLIFNIHLPKEKRHLFNKIRFSINVDGKRENIKGKIARRRLLGAIKRHIKNGRLCPFFQYARQWQFIILYLWYRTHVKIKENHVLMLSDSRAELSGNLAFIDEELRKHSYHIQYFFRRSLKEEKTLQDKKMICRMMAESGYIMVDDFYPIVYALPISKKTKLIQVWHAMGAFKTVGYSRLGKPGGPNPRSISHRNYTDAITSADGIRCNYAEAFQMPIEDVHATGIPRTDIFFNQYYIKNTRARLYDKYPRLRNKKVVMFAPTFRGNGQNTAYYNFDWIDFSELQESLGEDYQFIIKLHPFIKNTDSVPKDNAFFLDLTSEREINDLLFITDVLITDYSSVIFEASLLNINTIFYVPDLIEYTESRDFYYPFERYTFGRIAENMVELIDSIQHPENDLDKLSQFKKHFCDACDGHATERFVNTLFLEER